MCGHFQGEGRSYKRQIKMVIIKGVWKTYITQGVAAGNASHFMQRHCSISVQRNQSMSSLMESRMSVKSS